MHIRTVLTAATFSIATAAFAAQGTFERTLSVGASPTVTVNTGSGNVHVRPGSDSQIHIIGHVHAGSTGWFSGGSPESRIQQIVDNPPIVQNGNDITIGENHNNDLFRNISIDYDITVPKSSALSANSGSGDVDIQEVGSSLKAHSGSGNVRAHGIPGPATLGTGSGDIEFQQTSPGDVKAETGSGNITLHGISGALKSSTGSGNIEVEGQPSSDWRLSTGSGNIHLAVGNGARFNLDADTGSGSINVQQPITMQGSLNRHHINGVVNGGGATIRANTGSGDIQIR
jgi:Putative adhesin